MSATQRLPKLADCLSIPQPSLSIEQKVYDRAMLEEQRRLRKDANAMLDKMGSMLKELVHTRRVQSQEHHDLSMFGDSHAVKATRRASPLIAMELAQHLEADSAFMEMPLTQSELRDMYFANPEAIRALDLRPHAAARFQSAVLVALAEKRTDSAGVTGSFYLVAEASYTISSNNIENVLEHARIVQAATGIDTYAVVSGVRVAPPVSERVVDNALEYLNSDDEGVVFWYRLTQELEPAGLDRHLK